MNKKQPNSDPPDPDFEQSLAELDGVVRRLEQGDIGLSESLACYEQGVKLLRRCYDFLKRAERRIELLSGVDAEGNPLTGPVDDSALSLDEKAANRGHRRSTVRREPPAAGDCGEDRPSDMDRPGKLF